MLNILVFSLTILITLRLCVFASLREEKWYWLLARRFLSPWRIDRIENRARSCIGAAASRAGSCLRLLGRIRPRSASYCVVISAGLLAGISFSEIWRVKCPLIRFFSTAHSPLFIGDLTLADAGAHPLASPADRRLPRPLPSKSEHTRPGNPCRSLALAACPFSVLFVGRHIGPRPFHPRPVLSARRILHLAGGRFPNRPWRCSSRFGPFFRWPARPCQFDPTPACGSI